MTRYAFLLCGLLCLLLSGLSACGKIELPETDSGQNTKPPQGGDQSGDQSGGDNGQGTETQGDTMSVAAMLRRASVDDWVRVK